jgi:hypothetical protein
VNRLVMIHKGIVAMSFRTLLALAVLIFVLGVAICALVIALIVGNGAFPQGVSYGVAALTILALLFFGKEIL